MENATRISAGVPPLWVAPPKKKPRSHHIPHIENKTVACKKLMVMLNSNLRGMQAPKPKLSKWAYTGVVRPKLLYVHLHDLGKLNEHSAADGKAQGSE